MSLIAALNTARSSLAATAKQLAVSGRNIAGANDPSYTRKITSVSTSGEGGDQIVSITRAADAGLLAHALSSKSAGSAQQAILDGLNQLQDTVGDTDSTTSPAATIAALSSALQAEANSPSDQSLAQATVTAAQAAVSSLASATATVTSVRSGADAAMATSVTDVNNLLGQFADLNTQIVRGTLAGDDVSDLMDQRDAVLGNLSDELGVTTVQRANNDEAIYTDGGVPLFDKTARTVTFKPSTALPAGATGNAVYIDGVPVTGANATMPLKSGKLAGLAELRDGVTVTYQTQLDEMARGLVASLAESDQSGGGGPDLAGLVTWSGGPTVPPDGTAVPGLAGMLQVNPAVDPAQGGSLTRIRDGGINGLDYQYNTTGASSYADRLNDMLTDLGQTRNFDPASGLQSGVSLGDYGTASTSWLENLRQTTSSAVDYQTTLQSQATDALSNASGVNVDDEYTKQLQLEQSYQASSKLIGIVQQMFDTLLAAMGP